MSEADLDSIRRGSRNNRACSDILDVSIILCTWNNSKRLQITFDALTRCAIPQGLLWELVVVNNNCTDATDEVVASFKDRLPLTYVHEPRQGLSRARNAGLNAAKGDLIILIDDDVRPCADWLCVYCEAYKARPEGFFFGGPVESEFENQPPDPDLLPYAPWSVKGLSHGATARALQRDEEFIAANWACPAAALRGAGGFDERLGLDPSSGHVSVGEESDLMSRLKAAGMRGWYLPHASIMHWVPASKCALRHIADRIEAVAYYHAGFEPVETGRLRVRIGGVPLWCYRRTVHLWLRLAVARLMGRKGYDEYLALRQFRGRAARSRQALGRNL